MKARSVIIALLCLALPTVCHAQKKDITNANRPDILILDIASANGMETVNFTYPVMIPHTQVKRDLAALQASLGSQFHSVHIEDAPPPFPGETTKMTSASFVADHALASSPNTVAVEPLILALKPYKHLTLHYLVGNEYKFQGLRDYQDRYVTIAFTPASYALTYDIHINDPGFTKLNLPMYAPDPSTIQAATAVPAAPAPAHHSPWIILAIAVVALGLGGIAYSVLTRYF